MHTISRDECTEAQWTKLNFCRLEWKIAITCIHMQCTNSLEIENAISWWRHLLQSMEGGKVLSFFCSLYTQTHTYSSIYTMIMNGDGGTMSSAMMQYWEPSYVWAVLCFKKLSSRRSSQDCFTMFPLKYSLHKHIICSSSMMSDTWPPPHWVNVCLN